MADLNFELGENAAVEFADDSLCVFNAVCPNEAVHLTSRGALS